MIELGLEIKAHCKVPQGLKLLIYLRILVVQLLKITCFIFQFFSLSETTLNVISEMSRFVTSLQAARAVQ